MHAAPLYIAETAPCQIRGVLISLKEFFIVLGMLVSVSVLLECCQSTQILLFTVIICRIGLELRWLISNFFISQFVWFCMMNINSDYLEHLADGLCSW